MWVQQVSRGCRKTLEFDGTQQLNLSQGGMGAFISYFDRKGWRFLLAPPTIITLTFPQAGASAGIVPGKSLCLPTIYLGSTEITYWLHCVKIRSTLQPDRPLTEATVDGRFQGFSISSKTKVQQPSEFGCSVPLWAYAGQCLQSFGEGWEEG